MVNPYCEILCSNLKEWCKSTDHTIIQGLCWNVHFGLGSHGGGNPGFCLFHKLLAADAGLGTPPWKGPLYNRY